MSAPRSNPSTMNEPLELKSEPTLKQKNKKYYQVRNWWPELTAMFGSSALVVAIAVFLSQVNGTKLDDWSMPWHVKPNTVVSTFAALSRVLLLMVIAECISQLKWVYFEQRPHRLHDFQVFDEASRGPWGSICLIYTIRIRAIVASIGALTAVLALANEPFVQQLLLFPTLPVSESSVTVPAVTVYDFNTQDIPKTIDQSEQGLGLFMEWMAPELTQAAYARAVNQALGGANLDVAFVCPTGNCTWPKFYSLGVCSSCENVTAELKYNCWPTSYTIFEGGSDGVDINCRCNLTTPSGVTYAGKDGVAYGPDGRSNTLYKTKEMPNNSPNRLIGQNWAISALVTPPQLFNHPMFQGSDNACTGSPPLHAYECRLEWCAKSYESLAVRDGSLFGEPTRELPLRALPFIYDGTDCTKATFERETEDSDVPIYYAFQVLWTEATKAPLDCPVFPAGQSNEGIIWIRFAPGDGDGHPTWDYALNNTIRSGTSVTASTGMDELAAMVYTAHDYDFVKTIDGIARSLTTHLRTSIRSYNIVGEAHSTATFIHVNWLWLIHPALLVVLSTSFLVASMAFSIEKHKVIWKSSALAALFHGLRDFGPDELADVEQKDMEHVSKNLWVQLKKDEHGNISLLRSTD